MAETLILHSDLNCYYASVEMNEHPDLRGKQVAVCGSTENRHGIVLTASLMGQMPVAQDRCETVPMPSPMYQ